jgi:hypothetical protein
MPFAQIANTAPFNNINGSLVNVDNSHYSGTAFTNRVIPSTVNPAVLPEPLNNRQAANSYIPGCTIGGYKKKFKNISNMYKMSKTKRRHTLSKLKMKYNKKSYKSKRNKRSKSKIRTRTRTRTRTRSTSRSKRSYKGGYAQYQNNVPMTQTYSLGGYLNPNESALATPPPHNVLSNCTNCVDNYNHFTNKGFPSRGSY